MKRGVDSTGIPQSTLIDRYRPYYLAGVGDYRYAAASGTPVDCTVPWSQSGKLLKPKATGLQGRLLFSPVSQPVAHQWLPAGHRLTDWWAATLQLTAAAIDNRRATISACCAAVWTMKFMNLEWLKITGTLRAEFFWGPKALALLAQRLIQPWDCTVLNRQSSG